MQERTAIVLSGGGSKGDFEVGALRYLYDSGIRPDILAGSSVGAINALKLAEGDDDSSSGPQRLNAQQKLELIWRALHNENDMYLPEPWVQTIQDSSVREFFTRGLKARGPHATSAVTSWLRLPAMLMYGLITSGDDFIAVSDAIRKASTARSVFNLTPLENLLRQTTTFDPERVQRSGIALRLSVVGLESGALRHVTETGEILGADGATSDLISAALASASIPVIFPPRSLAGENYVDGGVRETLPLQPVVDAGATRIYAIVATQPTLPAPSFDESNLIDIATRAVGDIMVDETTAGDLLAVTNHVDNIGLTLIRPTIDIHDFLQIDSGLIDISIDYGYMRAADHLGVSPETSARSAQLSDRISQLRVTCWELEDRLSRGMSRKVQSPGNRATIDRIRSLKTEIHSVAQERRKLGAALPPDAHRLWQQWELHPHEMPSRTPWDRFITTFGPLPAQAPPESGE